MVIELTSILAEAGINVFVISGFDAEFLLLQEDVLQNAVICLQSDLFGIDVQLFWPLPLPGVFRHNTFSELRNVDDCS